MSRMLEMLRDLVAHKGHANATMLTAVRQHDSATADPVVIGLLHHVLLANRFWLLTVQGKPFVDEHEARPAASFEDLVRRYVTTQAEESAWLEIATQTELARVLEESVHSGRIVFGGPGVHAGVPALARPPGAMREAAPGTRRGAPDDRLHPMAGGSPGRRVARAIVRKAG